MPSFAELQARALERAMQVTRTTLEIDMDDTENQPEDQGNSSSNNTNLDDNTDAVLQRNLTVGEVTQLIWRYNLLKEQLLTWKNSSGYFLEPYL